MFNIKTNKKQNFNSADYHIFLLEEEEDFVLDLTTYQAPKFSILFMAPYQHIDWKTKKNLNLQLCFHADYYCIEYHKKEVACNGILFNNIYEKPYVFVGEKVFREIEEVVNKMQKEMEVNTSFSEAIIKTYLQLILAICSKEKSKTLTAELLNKEADKTIINFPRVLDQHFIDEKKVNFYANYFFISPSLFSKKIKQQFDKSPSQLIQERTVLEAKKLLHLTTKSIKEIAFQLKFEDEFYFSRYFKKYVGVSPSSYRKNVGLSIVAK